MNSRFEKAIEFAIYSTKKYLDSQEKYNKTKDKRYIPKSFDNKCSILSKIEFLGIVFNETPKKQKTHTSINRAIEELIFQKRRYSIKREKFTKKEISEEEFDLSFQEVINSAKQLTQIYETLTNKTITNFGNLGHFSRENNNFYLELPCSLENRVV
jgi:hypothetical protein